MTIEIPQHSEPVRLTLDAIDRRLVGELVADGRATLSILARKTNLSVSAVQYRVRRLKARGVITGYTAKVDPESFEQLMSAFVAITTRDPSQPDDAPTRLRHINGIESCHSVAGRESYILFVRVASPRHLECLVREIRATAAVNTGSTIILHTFYDHGNGSVSPRPESASPKL